MDMIISHCMMCCLRLFCAFCHPKPTNNCTVDVGSDFPVANAWGLDCFVCDVHSLWGFRSDSRSPPGGEWDPTFLQFSKFGSLSDLWFWSIKWFASGSIHLLYFHLAHPLSTGNSAIDPLANALNNSRSSSIDESLPCAGCLGCLWCLCHCCGGRQLWILASHRILDLSRQHRLCLQLDPRELACRLFGYAMSCSARLHFDGIGRSFILSHTQAVFPILPWLFGRGCAILWIWRGAPKKVREMTAAVEQKMFAPLIFWRNLRCFFCEGVCIKGFWSDTSAKATLGSVLMFVISQLFAGMYPRVRRIGNTAEISLPKDFVLRKELLNFMRSSDEACFCSSFEWRNPSDSKSVRSEYL